MCITSLKSQLLCTYKMLRITMNKGRYDYKEQYERFKLIVNMIGVVLALTNLYFEHRTLDLIFFFLIVWYYCTLTIRESILKVNGSKIKVCLISLFFFLIHKIGELIYRLFCFKTGKYSKS